jgi:cathepsin L
MQMASFAGREMHLAAISVLLLLAAVVFSANATNDDFSDEAWQAFKLRYGKNYADPKEDSLRRGIREVMLRMMNQHNEEADRGLHSFKLGENQLIDMTPAEYRKMLGYRSSAQLASAGGSKLSRHRRRRQASQPPMPIYTNTSDVSTLPATVNWTAAGWVGPVMNQGQCGSCWSYSSAGAIEAQYMNYTGTWVQLSEQNLIDCSSSEGNLGCDGGNIDDAFWYVQTNGIESLAMYPDVSNVTGVSNQTCAFNPSDSITTVNSWRNVEQFNELALQQAVALTGPVSVAIDAGLMSFQIYKSGVYAPTACSTTNLDHAVLVVGYGVSGTQPYWLIQNSWGTSWGIAGYMMMARNDNNMCGIATEASFPVIG